MATPALDITFPGNLSQVANAATLRAVPSALLKNGDLYIVTGLGKSYAYDPGSVSIDDGQNVIKPDDRSGLQAGRWLYLVDGIAPGAQGPTGPADNTFSSYAAMQASDPTRKSARLVGDTDTPPRADGSYSNPTQTLGGWAPQTDEGVQFTPSVTNPKLRSSGAKVREIEVSITDKVGVVRDTNVDYSVPIQELFDYKRSLGGGVVIVPEGNFNGNVIGRHQVSLRGRGRGASSLTAATAQHVFRTPTDASCNNFSISDISLVGNLAHTGKDVIHLEPVLDQTFNDHIILRDILVTSGGRYGISTKGIDSNGPFVQLLKMTNVESNFNNKCSFFAEGTVIETIANHCAFTSPLDASAGASAVRFDYNGDYPLRFTATNCLFSNPAPLAAGVFGPAVFIGAGAQINFFGCNFEFFQTGIYLEDFVFASGVTVTGSNFAVGPGDTTAAGIWMKHNDASAIFGNTFKVASGGVMVDAIRLDNGPDKVRMPAQGGNTLKGNVQNYVKDVSGHIVTIGSNGNAVVYRDVQALIPPGGAIDLVALVDEVATTGRFFRGQRITIYAQSGTVTVKNGTGNIYLNGAVDYALSGVKSLTLVWSGGVWLEAGRS